MTNISDEIPFTTDALRLYIKEAIKELEKLRPSVNQFNRLKNRLKTAKERLDKRHDN